MDAKKTANVYQFPMTCPECHANKGMPYRASTIANGGTNVCLRCDDCGNDWQLEMTAAPFGLNGKADRGQRDRDGAS
jgi:transcription elongation factor Elf1